MTKDLLPNRSLVRRKIADVRDLKTKIELLREDWQKDDLNRQYLELVKVICIGLGALTTRFHSLSATVILPIQALELRVRERHGIILPLLTQAVWFW